MSTCMIPIIRTLRLKQGFTLYVNHKVHISSFLYFTHFVQTWPLLASFLSDGKGECGIARRRVHLTKGNIKRGRMAPSACVAEESPFNRFFQR
jgi:hypothetical protein